MDSWVQLINGGRFSLDGSPHDLRGLTVEDIAKSLSQITRYRGATKFPITVAEHSVMVSRIAGELGGREAALYGLVHDVHEIVVSDIPSPLKKFFADTNPHFAQTLRYVEGLADVTLWPVLGVRYPMPEAVAAIVKRADLIALAVEKRDATVDSFPWSNPEKPLPGYCVFSHDSAEAAALFRRQLVHIQQRADV